MGSHMAVSVQRLLSPRVLQGEDSCVLGAVTVRRIRFGGGQLCRPSRGDPSAGGEAGPEQLLPERGIWLSS